MRYKEESLEELHRIREKYHEKTKNMSMKEILKDISKNASEIEKKYGMNLKKVTG